MQVDEKSTLSFQAPVAADIYWLNYTSLPSGWEISTAEQHSKNFQIQTGPVKSNTLVSLELHQLNTAKNEEQITPIKLAVDAIEEPPVFQARCLP